MREVTVCYPLKRESRHELITGRRRKRRMRRG
jgi:hypothetical protein